MNLTTTQLKEIHDTLIPLVKEAGAIAMKYRKSGKLGLEHKPDKDCDSTSMVTLADKEIDEFLKTELTTRYPDFGWLSEETVDDSTRLDCKQAWVVDPIDGTKSFVRGENTFSVSVALVEDGKPVIGIVFSPASDEFYSAYTGSGIFENGKLLQNRKFNSFNEALCLMSRTENKEGMWEGVKKECNVTGYGSIAYKLALVAGGKADMMGSLKPKNEWDVAAGHMLCQEAGVIVTDINKTPLTYNKPVTLIDRIVAAPEKLYANLYAAMHK